MFCGLILIASSGFGFIASCLLLTEAIAAYKAAEKMLAEIRVCNDEFALACELARGGQWDEAMTVLERWADRDVDCAIKREAGDTHAIP